MSQIYLKYLNERINNMESQVKFSTTLESISEEDNVSVSNVDKQAVIDKLLKFKEIISLSV